MIWQCSKKGIKFAKEVGLKMEPKVAPQIGHITEKRVREKVKENTSNTVQKKTACGEFKNVFIIKS